MGHQGKDQIIEECAKALQNEWAEWAKTLPNPPAKWTRSWDEISDGMKEVNRRLATAVVTAYEENAHARSL